MAADERLLALAESGQAGCRVYSWSGPWVTLGKFQNPERDLVRGSGVPWIFRPTGGKAVLHGHDVTVGLAAPLESDGRSLRATYRNLTGPIIAALRACGLPAALGEDTRFAGKGPRVADCFAHVSRNDIVDERTGQKVCGCALQMTRSAVLLQASIPVGKPLVNPAAVIVGGKAISAPAWRHADFARELAAALSK